MLGRGARHSELQRLQASVYLQNKSGPDSKGTFSFLLCSSLCLERGIVPARVDVVFGPHSLPSVYLTSRGSTGNHSLKFTLFLANSFYPVYKLLSSVNDFGLLSAWFNSSLGTQCQKHSPFGSLAILRDSFLYEEVGFNWSLPFFGGWVGNLIQSAIF